MNTIAALGHTEIGVPEVMADWEALVVGAVAEDYGC